MKFALHPHAAPSPVPAGRMWPRALVWPALFTAYFVLVCLVTYPAIAQLETHLIGFVHGDGYEMAHHLWWFRYALQTGQPLFTQTLLGYPDGISGVTLWANPLQFVPGWLLSLVVPLPVAYNLPMLLHMAGNGTAAALLLSALFRRARAPGTPATSAEWAAAGVGGVVFMLYPVMLGHLAAGHSGLMVQWPLPLYALALIRAGEAAEARQPARVVAGRIAWAAAWFVFGAWGHTLQAIYALGPITLALAGGAWFGRRPRGAAAMLAGAALGAALLAAWLLPVLRETLGTAAYTGEGGAVRYSTDLLALVSPSFRHPLWGAWLDYPRRVLGINLDEGAAYLGVFTAALALIAMWRVRTARVWLGLGALAWVFSLGPLLKILDTPIPYAADGYTGFITGPFAVLAELPGVGLARTPGRFTFAVALAAAVLAGWGARVVLGRWAGRVAGRARPWAVGAAAVVLAGLIAFDTLTFWPLPTTPAAIPSAIAALGRGENPPRAVFDAPWGDLIVAKEALYLQTAHTLPLIAGQVTRRTPVSSARLDLLQTFDPALLALAGADLVIVYRDAGDAALEARARERLGPPMYEDARYLIFDTRPAAAAAPPITAPIGLPAVNVSNATTPADSFISTLPYRAPIFSPADGWLRIAGGVHGARPNAAFTITWEGAAAARIEADASGTAAFDTVLPMRAGAFTAVEIAPVLACPAVVPEGARCPAHTLALSAVDFTDLSATETGLVSAAFGNGTVLDAASVVQEADGTWAAYLAWRFTRAVAADAQARFVHVLNSADGPAAQQDTASPARQAGETVTERVVLAGPGGLAGGPYRVLVGWYAYPSLERACVWAAAGGGAAAGAIESGACSAETTLEIGRFGE